MGNGGGLNLREAKQRLASGKDDASTDELRTEGKGEDRKKGRKKGGRPTARDKVISVWGSGTRGRG